MKLSKIKSLLIIFLLTGVCLYSNTTRGMERLRFGNEQTGHRLHGFTISPYFDEQILTFNYSPDVRIFINAPPVDSFDVNKPVEVILFALPNGNTIEQTIGKILKPGDDWHYDIQHIGAQTRFLRENTHDYNIVTVYLEASQKSWPTWRGLYSNNAEIIHSIVDSVKNIFKNFNPFVVLTGHSGGGSFTFGYMNSVSKIPASIKRISFLDSDYNYTDTYGKKILDWLNASNENYLCVIAYNDSVALYNGNPIVSPTGGTWYRSKLMQKYLSNYFTFSYEEDSEFLKYTAENGRIKFILKKNPTRAILHTVQVERNGFIEGILSGTQYEGKNYTYYGERAYSKWIQGGMIYPKQLTIPPRPPDAITGSAFMKKVENMTFEDRETQIYNEISKGNIPDFLRDLVTIHSNFKDANGITHSVTYQVMPDYLAIGSNEDFCRIPMGPITAQRLAVLFGAELPTSKLVDDISLHATVRLAPITYTPVGNQNELVSKFVEHNAAIEQARIAAGGELGWLIDGIKKDVVISNKITDPTRPNHVVIYGWYKLDGTPIQPLTNIHINTYVDYSHGIRLLNSEVIIDSTIKTIPEILKDPVLYKIFSNENGVMTQPSYLAVTGLPETPRSFGIINAGEQELKIILKPDTAVQNYVVYLSSDGVHFNNSVILNPSDFTIKSLKADSLYFIKIAAENEIGESAASEVLAGIPSTQTEPDILIVNGFDRRTSGNTLDFTRQHGTAIYKNNFHFNSATNDAVLDGLVTLTDYKIADYILGEESTVDETFSSAEQMKIKEFLQNGGNLFLSGAEIAWDLDYKGSAADKDFIWNYLKIKYSQDAPNNQPGVYFKVEPVSGTMFENLPAFYFDDGTHGTYIVKYPDVVTGINGGTGILKYSGVSESSGYGGIFYDGMFPSGTKKGKLLYLGFPFETIYPDSTRRILMNKILEFFSSPSGTETGVIDQLPKNFELYQNYPNPFNPETTIKFALPHEAFVLLKIYSIDGREVAVLVNSRESAGFHTVNFNANRLASGVYLYTISADGFFKSKKLMVLK